MFGVSRNESLVRLEDLALPPDLLAHLRVVAALRVGTLLLTGTAGGPKALVAEGLAHAIGCELVRVDTVQVVSRYIGETEKNLDRIFAGAWANGSVLFFDEADALFRKRSSVGDSHDRYANVDVNYLLRKLVGTRSLIILSTNVRQNIDPAFLHPLVQVVNVGWPLRER